MDGGGSTITAGNPSIGSTEVSGVNSTLELMFSMLRTSHGGDYTCVATISIPYINTNVNQETSESVIVQSESLQSSPVQYYSIHVVAVSVPPPTLNVASSDLPAYNGTVFSLTGRAMLHAAVDTGVIITGRWSRMDTELSSTVQSEPPYSTVQRFNLSGSDGGEYVYTVSVTPSDTTFIRPISAGQTYSVDVVPYPPLNIVSTTESGRCVADPTATLRGDVTLLDNTVPGSIVEYTWTGPDGNPTGGNQNMLQVEVIDANVGNYILTVCLDIPASDIANHCYSTMYSVSVTGTSMSPACLSCADLPSL